MSPRQMSPRQPPQMIRGFSFQLDNDIEKTSSEIVTFSKPIEDDLYYYDIRLVTPSIYVYSGEFTLENPDFCLCLEISSVDSLKIEYADGITLFSSMPIEMYNVCYKQFYLFSRIFKKLVNCGGSCITNPAFNQGKVHNFTQSSYCCGYYSAVAAVMYRYYQQLDTFPGKPEIIDFSTFTMDHLNIFVDNFKTENVSHVLVKLFNLAMSYTSYFSNYILKNPLQGVRTNFSHTNSQNCEFNYTDEIIQLASIYATTDGITTTYHHFCTYNLGNYILISDAWAAGRSRRPLWTRFISTPSFRYVIDMIQTNTSDLSSDQLNLIKLFFLQPDGSTFLPTIKICYLVIDFLIDGKMLLYSNGSEMELNKPNFVFGGTKRKKRRISIRKKTKNFNTKKKGI